MCDDCIVGSLTRAANDDYNGCGAWEGEPGASRCCIRPLGHDGPHKAFQFWPNEEPRNGDAVGGDS